MEVKPTTTAQKQPTRATQSSSDQDYESFSFLPTLSILFLTFNTVIALVRAYSHEDYQMIAFVLFIYLGFMSLFACLNAFHRLPRQEESGRKECLKVAIWVISTALNLGLAIKFAPLLYPIASVFIFAMAIATSGCGFYFFFIYREEQQGSKCSSAIKIKSSTYSSVDDKKIKSIDSPSPLDKV